MVGKINNNVSKVLKKYCVERKYSTGIRLFRNSIGWWCGRGELELDLSGGTGTGWYIQAKLFLAKGPDWPLSFS